ncbi:MAG: hypothetical protein HQL63_14850 [Magnetococcales bacterium]|nr:hypothetical protein [Magnetococcales bacterium]MBF0323110.1 hypothetical protein [Magnetococcales bacterium]
MKIEEWIGLFGVVFLLVVVFLAVMPRDAREPPSASGVAAEPVKLTVPQAGFVGSPSPDGGSLPAFPGMGQMLNVAATRPMAPEADLTPVPVPTPTEGAAPAQPGLMPFERAPMVRFTGTIQQITEMPQQDRQMHIWIHAGAGVESHISVGPQWFLSYLGCDLRHDQQVTGKGFRFDRSSLNSNPVIYAKQMLVNGRWCQLRNDEGFALWSNQLR